jgi:DNA-binding NarL/FixJ family response regulator
MAVLFHDNGILIVDARPLRGAGLAAIVQQLIASNCRIALIASASDAEERIDGGVTFQMIIYSIGSDLVGDLEHRKAIKNLQGQAKSQWLISI